MASCKYLQFLTLFCITCLILSSDEVNSKVITKRGLMDNINDGLKYAGQLLNINTASDVANLVAKAFSQNAHSKKPEGELATFFENRNDVRETFNPVGLITNVLRLMGFDGGKLGALAINGIIFMAQMIGNVLGPKRAISKSSGENSENDRINEPQNSSNDQEQPEYEQRTARSGSPVDWLIENPSDGLRKLLNEARDGNLPENLEKNIENYENNEGEADCVKLLICKSSPFIRGMQQALGDRIENGQEENSRGEEGSNDRLSIFFKYLPNVKEYQTQGKICEKRYPNCSTMKMEKSKSKNL